MLYYTKYRSKQKNYWHTINIKIEKNYELKKPGIKNRTCHYFDVIIKIEVFDFDNILSDEKSDENFLIYDVLHKTLIVAKLLRIIYSKVDGFIRDYDGT